MSHLLDIFIKLPSDKRLRRFQAVERRVTAFPFACKDNAIVLIRELTKIESLENLDGLQVGRKWSLETEIRFLRIHENLRGGSWPLMEALKQPIFTKLSDDEWLLMFEALIPLAEVDLLKKIRWSAPRFQTWVEGIIKLIGERPDLAGHADQFYLTLVAKDENAYKTDTETSWPGIPKEGFPFPDDKKRHARDTLTNFFQNLKYEH